MAGPPPPTLRLPVLTVSSLLLLVPWKGGDPRPRRRLRGVEAGEIITLANRRSVSHSQAAGIRGAIRATFGQSSYFTRARPSGRWKPARDARQLEVVRPRRALPRTPRPAFRGLPARSPQPCKLRAVSRAGPGLGFPGARACFRCPGRTWAGRGEKPGKAALGHRGHVRLRARGAGRGALGRSPSRARRRGRGGASLQSCGSASFQSAEVQPGLARCKAARTASSSGAAGRRDAHGFRRTCMYVKDEKAAEFVPTPCELRWSFLQS